ncbi:MAG: chalcone isomerase family protein [Deltaproteobacteria bacterium]|jgi:hypothetical protein|nr:chalcone isomerase family protein [Deltaproteobacteria bacterium]
MSFTIRHVTAIWVIIFLLAASVHGAEIEDVSFEDSVEVNGTRITLRGAGLFRYMGFIKAYVGALYMLEDTPSEKVLSDTPKRLEIEYFHPIKAKDFGSASKKIMARNVEPEAFEKLKHRLEQLNALYQDVQPGDRYSLDYFPGKGIELALNGNFLGFVTGADFASAVYAMWLGEKPMNNSFKQQLLGAS